MPPHEQPDALLAALRHSDLIGQGARILVAFSAGPDSTALLLGLRELGHDIVAAHYDHALQPGSESAAAYAGRLCASHGIPFRSERRTTPLPRGSVQAGARRLRYDFLARCADDIGVSTIALGHTADDLVEGAVMHLLRGCGIAGLRGMPAARGRFVRPMLDVWREDVAAYLQRRGITALEDPANSNVRYRRVSVRRELLPALERGRPGITRRFHAAARQAAQIQSSIESLAAAAGGGDTLPAAALRSLPEPIAAETLRALYHRAGGPDPSLGRAHIAAMLRILRGGPGGRGLDLPAGLRFRLVDSQVQVVPRVIEAMEASLQVDRCSGCESRDAAHLQSGLDLRIGFRSPGLRMRPARGGGTRKLQDIFVDAKVPREDRDGWPLVFAGERLAWVPGLAVDADLQSPPGEPSLHVTVTRILAARKGAERPMLESPDSPPGEPS